MLRTTNPNRPKPQNPQIHKLESVPTSLMTSADGFFTQDVTSSQGL